VDEGNIVIGYDGLRSENSNYFEPECSRGTKGKPYPFQFPVNSQAECLEAGGTWQLNHKGGSHYLVASGQYATVGAGSDNVASGPRTSISGGAFNDAIKPTSSVSGGTGNSAEGEKSAISGGAGNTASGAASSISGGRNLEVTDVFGWGVGED